MATYCRMTADGITVTQVVKVADEDNIKNGVENEGGGITFLTNLYNWPHWRKSSQNTSAGKHWTRDAEGVVTESADQSKAFRFNPGAVGMIYDSARDMFRMPSVPTGKDASGNVIPFSSWTLNELTGQYEAPVAKVEKADDGVDATHPLPQQWDEANQEWSLNSFTLGNYTPVGNIINL